MVFGRSLHAVRREERDHHRQDDHEQARARDNVAARLASGDIVGPLDVGALRYPPYTRAQEKRLVFLIANLPGLPSVGVKDVVIAGLAAALAWAIYTIRTH